MPLPIAGGIFAWLVGLFGSAIGSLATWFMQRMVYEKAVHYALITAFLVTASGLFLAVSLSIKAAILAIQYNMPPMLAAVTFFLPTNINQVLALIVTVRVARSIYALTIRTMAAYLPGNPSYGLNVGGR
jgi:hypothetical protein